MNKALFDLFDLSTKLKYILDKKAFRLEHHLNPYFDEIRSYKTYKDFKNSIFYKEHKDEINRIIYGVEWRNNISTDTKKEAIRVVAWNVERGTNLEGITQLFQTNETLAAADILLLTETDIGMGRSSNFNIPFEIAKALDMNYCFANSFLVLGKGDISEQEHKLENTLSFHGTSILSKFKILSAHVIPLYKVKNVFHSSERRLGQRKGLICQIKIGNHIYDFAVAHFDISSSPKQRALQMDSLIRPLSDSKSKAKLVGGDFNTSTYNAKNKVGLIKDLLYKFMFVGFNKVMKNYMTPEANFDKPLFDMIKNHQFDIDNYNDKSTATFYYDFNELILIEKMRLYVPDFSLRWLKKKLSPWGGISPSRLDWFAGQGFQVIQKNYGIYSPPQIIEKPLWLGKQISDHNPIIVDLMI